MQKFAGMEGMGGDAMGDDLDDTDDEGNKSLWFRIHLFIYVDKHKLLHLMWGEFQISYYGCVIVLD